MSRRIRHFLDEITQLMNRFRSEYDMTYAEVIGCLEVVKYDLLEEMSSPPDEYDEEDDIETEEDDLP